MHPNINPKEAEFYTQMLRVLEKDRPKEISTFNMATAISTGKSDVCGFTACAIGHAALDPWFMEQGLRAKTNYCNDGSILGFDGIYFGDELVSFDDDIDELKTAFALDPRAFENLFSGDYPDLIGYTTPQDVIEAIKFYLENGETPDWTWVPF